MDPGLKQQQPGVGGAAGQTITNNVQYNNNGATEDRAGKALAQAT
jgi:hypothetical protein